MDERVRAIREDEYVGIGSCSVLDECYTDNELIELLDERLVTTVQGALEVAYAFEGLQREQAQNCAWDGPTDRDDHNPNEMTADEWSDFYGDCKRRTGMDFNEYLDHDHSMDY